MRAHFLQFIFLFLLVHNSEFLGKPNQELLYQTTFWCDLVLNGLSSDYWTFCGAVLLAADACICAMCSFQCYNLFNSVLNVQVKTKSMATYEPRGGGGGHSL